MATSHKTIVALGRRATLIASFAWTALAVVLPLNGFVFADDPKAAAVQLSDQAFALLGSVGSGDASKALVGPIAGFAGDAQTLSTALGKDDRAAAGQAISELQTDRSAVDSAINAHPGILDHAKWESLKQQLDALTRAIPPSSVSSASAAPIVGSFGGGESRPMGDLKVKIQSLGVDAEQITHVKGYLAGHDLASAGVYSGGREIRALDIGPPPERGSLRIQFDIQLAEIEPGTVVRVYDKFGHRAEAQVTAGASSSSSSVEPAERAEPADTGGVIVNHGDETSPPADDDGGANTSEIPANAPPSPSKRHIKSHIGPLSDVQIYIDNVVIVDSALREFQVAGRIAGNRVERAAIYVDGRLSQELDLASPDSFGVRAFNQTFVLNGSSATIRVYGSGDQYVENSIRAPGVTVPGSAIVPGYGVNPYAYGATPYGVPYSYGVSPYAVNPYARPVNPYAPAIPGYNSYNTSPNINVGPGYNPYGYPYLGVPRR